MILEIAAFGFFSFLFASPTCQVPRQRWYLLFPWPCLSRTHKTRYSSCECEHFSYISVTLSGDKCFWGNGVVERRGHQGKTYLIILPVREINLEGRQGELLAYPPLVMNRLRLQRGILCAVSEEMGGKENLL